MGTAHRHSDESPAQRAFLHFYVGVFLGLVTVLATIAMHGLAPVVALDRLGQDKVQQIYVGARPPSPIGEPIVLLDFNFPRSGNGPESGALADAITAIAPHRPRAIIIDQEITRSVSKDMADKFVDAVTDAAARGIEVVLVPALDKIDHPGKADYHVIPSGIDQLIAAPPAHVIIASDLLHTDPDGVIRHFRTTDCIEMDGEGRVFPTFSASLTVSHDTSCHHHVEERPIHFVVSREILADSPALTRVDMRHGDVIGRIGNALTGKIVLIGETAPSDWADIHTTPLGSMPGALIHANILLTPQEAHFDWVVFALGTLVYANLGALTVLFWCMRRQSLWRDDLALRDPWRGGVLLAALLVSVFVVPIVVAQRNGHLEAAESVKLSMELASVLFASSMFALQARLAERAALGRPEWLAALVWLVTFSLMFSLVVGAIVLSWFAFGSLLLSAGLIVGSLLPAAAVCVEALIKAGKHIIDPLHGFIKWLNLRSAGLLLLAWLSGTGIAVSAETPQATAPKQTSTTLSRSWTAFTELLTKSPEAQSVRRGVNVRYRGTGSVALQWLPTIPVDGAALPAGEAGLTLVWTGGKPPFFVSLESESGLALGAVRTDSRLVRIPGFVMPPEPVSVQVSNDSDPPITAVIRPAAPEPRQAPTPADAVDGLATTTPDRRLDALRRLSSIAATDPDAARAIGLVQQTADVPP